MEKTKEEIIQEKKIWDQKIQEAIDALIKSSEREDRNAIYKEDRIEFRKILQKKARQLRDYKRLVEKLGEYDHKQTAEILEKEYHALTVEFINMFH